MFHPPKARIVSPNRAAALARRQLGSLSRPSGSFDASRYFRAANDLRFHNVGMPVVRKMARTIVLENRDTWTVDAALAFAEVLMADPYLEAKGLGIETPTRQCGRRASPNRKILRSSNP